MFWHIFLSKILLQYSGKSHLDNFDNYIEGKWKRGKDEEQGSDCEKERTDSWTLLAYWDYMWDIKMWTMGVCRNMTNCKIGPYLNNDCVRFLKQGPWLTYFILVPVCPVFLLGRRHVEPQVLQHITCSLGPGGIWKAKRLLIVSKIFQDIGQVSFREVCIVKLSQTGYLRMSTSLFRRQRFYKETL